MDYRRLVIPRRLDAAAAAAGRSGWLATLPATLAEVTQRWRLSVGDPFQPGGATAWVAPVRNRAGGNLVLKLAWAHPEASNEADGLRVWAGQGAVTLYAAEDFDHTMALLLERCLPGRALSTQTEPAQDVVIAGLLRRLWIEPPGGGPFLPLRDMCEQWADEFDVKPAAPDLDPGLTRAGIQLFRQLPGDAPRQVLLWTDLHADNVLAAQRERWLGIDPKPYLGDPTYDVLQHLLNCPTRLRSDPLGLATRLANLAGLDPERTRLWLFARCVQESRDRPGLTEVVRRIAPS